MKTIGVSTSRNAMAKDAALHKLPSPCSIIPIYCLQPSAVGCAAGDAMPARARLIHYAIFERALRQLAGGGIDRQHRSQILGVGQQAAPCRSLQHLRN